MLVIAVLGLSVKMENILTAAEINQILSSGVGWLSELELERLCNDYIEVLDHVVDLQSTVKDLKKQLQVRDKYLEKICGATGESKTTRKRIN